MLYIIPTQHNIIILYYYLNASLKELINNFSITLKYNNYYSDNK